MGNKQNICTRFEYHTNGYDSAIRYKITVNLLMIAKKLEMIE